MPKARTSTTLHDQIADFEQQNPKLLRAMQLFGITMTEYQYALNSLYAPRIITSNSTVRMDSRRYGKQKLERHR